MGDTQDWTIGRRYWWVNQNQTYTEEHQGGFMWSPKANRNGARNQFYDNMTEVDPGDVVFCFRKTYISDVGVVQSVASTAPKPDFGGAGDYWSNEGWYVPVEYEPLAKPFRPKEHMDVLAPLLPEKYSPLQRSGDGLQSVYLAEVEHDLAMALLDLADAAAPEIWPADADRFEDREAEGLLGPPTTETEQLRLARRGQGLFKANVRFFEDGCRLTGTSDIRFLRASHIKPWSQSDSRERLDGANGLLLAPHVDHLFDRGWISFAADGRLIASSELPRDLLDQWSIVEGDPRLLHPRQEVYMNYHRSEIFRG